ncbi:hypothetical protein L3Y34_017833 [Caenorhabditis briggsae]|uniref:Glycosyltransferase family 92 protein n=1 Tax=Caenorhabditis briggsae TaxID=6238 RepID=A0AAE9DKZ2_CAEBR|nr:hypothetical protein L3Y34_017833 [Caenorhabditis briggsae]
MRLLLPLLLLFASTSAFNSFEFDYDIPTDYFGPKRHLIESVGRTPSERGDPDPNTAGQMNLRFKEDVFGVLNSRSRAHFDDLAQYFHPKIQIHVCFVPGRALKKNELWAVMAYLSLFYQKLHDVEITNQLNEKQLIHGLFLPYGVEEKLKDFEDFGDWITEDAQIVVCDEPKMNKDEFIRYMADRYSGIRLYSNNTYTHQKFNQHFEIYFSTTWEAQNTTKFMDTYVFRVKKEEQWVPYMNQGFSFWKIYWVTKKCTRDVTQHIALLDGATILGEVNKRFCGMINGENWDVYQSFLDLFEKSDTQWGTCAGSKRQTYDHIRGHMEKVATRYAKCTVYVRIRNLVAADFSTTFLVSRATEVQEQEELDVGFAGFKDKKGLWQMNRMYFECDETKKKKKRMILDL